MTCSSATPSGYTTTTVDRPVQCYGRHTTVTRRWRRLVHIYVTFYPCSIGLVISGGLRVCTLGVTNPANTEMQTQSLRDHPNHWFVTSHFCGVSQQLFRHQPLDHETTKTLESSPGDSEVCLMHSGYLQGITTATHYISTKSSTVSTAALACCDTRGVYPPKLGRHSHDCLDHIAARWSANLSYAPFN